VAGGGWMTEVRKADHYWCRTVQLGLPRSGWLYNCHVLLSSIHFVVDALESFCLIFSPSLSIVNLALLCSSYARLCILHGCATLSLTGRLFAIFWLFGLNTLSYMQMLCCLYE